MVFLLALKNTIVLIFFLIFLSSIFVVKNNNQKRNLPDKNTKVVISLPLKLIIPAINVSANIESVGINSQGEMDTPKDTTNVGWFNLGPLPGATGSAVMAGHFNDKNNNLAIFANLDKLKIGDTIIVENNNSEKNIFTVFKVKVYDSIIAPDVFDKSDGVYLNLVTCDGVWNKSKQSYSQRLVVFAH